MTDKVDFFQDYAAYYDQLAGNAGSKTDDIDYYCSLSCYGPSVLEIGCGTGRLLVELQQVFDFVVGVDASKDMLSKAREKTVSFSNVELVRQDAVVGLPQGPFSVVIVPWFALNYICEPSDIEAIIRNIHASLTPGGFVCFDIFFPKVLRSNFCGDIWSETKSFKLSNGQMIYRKDERKVIDRIEFRTQSFDIGGSKKVLNSSRRFISPSALSLLLKKNGFRSIQIGSRFKNFEDYLSQMPEYHFQISALRTL
jgi:SAM-dependent methyltransferase